MDRGGHLEWGGCVNVRDLGGLPTVDGGRTRSGALVRSDSPHRLTDAGWAAAWDHGIRTVIDLRHAHERDEAVDADLAAVRAPLVEGAPA